MYSIIDRPLIYDLDLPELQDIFESWGEPGYRAIQVWQGLYQKLWDQPASFTSLPIHLRNRLAEYFSFSHLSHSITLDSHDGHTRKTLFHLPDAASVETVRMRYGDENGDRKRRTLCISTQSGCAMGCTFCATSQMGFHRNLSSGEIVEQVLYFSRQLALSTEKVTNLVIMGMGEPFQNYEATMQAIDRLNNAEGFNFGARRFTISTVGLIPGIRRFIAEDRQVNLAVSLHAATDELRSTLLPINRKYPLDELLSACLDYVEHSHRRITFEWVLIKDVNDTMEQAQALSDRLGIFRRENSTLCHVNIIPLNVTRRYSGKSTSRQRAIEFQDYLQNHGIPCTIRLRRGLEIQAGCGQLAGRHSIIPDIVR